MALNDVRRGLGATTSGILLLSLLFIFLGQRAFAPLGGLGTAMTWLGVLGTVLAVVSRTWLFLTGDGRQRALHLTLLLCHLGVVAGLFGYWLTTDAGLALLGYVGKEEIAHFRTGASVLWSIVLAASLIPTLLVEITIGMSGRFAAGREQAASVEVHRIKEAVSNGLSIALAMSFLMVTCNVAKEKNVQKDVSYFKTSGPGGSTTNIVKSLEEPLRVMLFFPDVNEVANEVESYFEALAQTTNNIDIQRYDRLRDSVLAEEYKATRDGTIVLAIGAGEEKDGERTEKITVNADIEKARRNELRELDKKIQQALMKIVRKRRVAYLTVGHGELTQTGAKRKNVIGAPGLDRASELRSGLRLLNYEVKEYRGLGQPIPEDATMVISIGPVTPYTPEELRAFDEYLAGGGKMLIALDPTGEAELGILEQRLGLKFDPTPLNDDKQFIPVRRQNSDRQIIVTNQFSSHASVTVAGRQGPRLGAPFFLAGSIEEVVVEGGKLKRTNVIRSMSTSWRDGDGDHTFNAEAGEKRARYNLMTAVEMAEKPPEGQEEMRAVLIADAEIFSDLAVRRSQLPAVLFGDAVRWLGGEEKYAGDTKREKDVRIVHSKKEDVVWFYVTILGAPLFVLLFGLGIVFWRRRATRRRTV